MVHGLLFGDVLVSLQLNLSLAGSKNNTVFILTSCRGKWCLIL